jgi:hypothetical protein
VLLGILDHSSRRGPSDFSSSSFSLFCEASGNAHVSRPDHNNPKKLFNQRQDQNNARQKERRAKSAAEIDTLASEIAAAATGSVVAAADAEILAFARTAAQAELDLARIRGMKTVTMSSLLAAASLPVAAVSHDTEMDLVAISPSGRPLF